MLFQSVLLTVRGETCVHPLASVDCVSMQSRQWGTERCGKARPGWGAVQLCARLHSLPITLQPGGPSRKLREGEGGMDTARVHWSPAATSSQAGHQMGLRCSVGPQPPSESRWARAAQPSPSEPRTRQTQMNRCCGFEPLSVGGVLLYLERAASESHWS